MSLHELTIHEARDLLRGGEVTSRELTEAILDRILAVDNEIKAYLCLMPEPALADAQRADELLVAARRDGHSKDLPALLGIPLA